MTTILDGRAIARDIRREVAAEVTGLVTAGGRRPGLAALLVGDDPASRVYVGSKAKASSAAGFLSETHELPSTSSAADVLMALEGLNRREEIDGIIVQLPLPAGLPEAEILESVAPEKDVDGIHPVNVGRLWLDREGPAPATPAGIVEILRRSGIETAGRRAVIVGRSQLVGKPLAALLLREQCTVTVCHSRTRDLAAVTREADILIAAVGRAAMLGAEHVRPGAVVIDVGINRISDPALLERLFPGNRRRRATMEKRGAVLVGDVDYEAVAPTAAAITPVPGGVGPLTVAMLLVNTLDAARRRQRLAPGSAPS